MAAPAGPYQAAKCSGSVHIRQTRSAGASRVRSITTAFSELRSSVIVFACLSLGLELPDVVVHAVEAGLPDRSVLLGPGRDLRQWCGLQRAGAVLGPVSTHHQPRALQHLELFRERRQ